jgi:hypothetical protein
MTRRRRERTLIPVHSGQPAAGRTRRTAGAHLSEEISMNHRTRRAAQGAAAGGVALAASLMGVGAASAATPPTITRAASIDAAALKVDASVFDARYVSDVLRDLKGCLACGLLGFDERFLGDPDPLTVGPQVAGPVAFGG